MYWLVLIRASCDISFPVWVSLKNTSSIVLANLNQQFTCCISSFYVCVSVCGCVYWFGLLLLFVLFLYWYIMEEFELPWAIVSFHYFLFYFVLRVAMCVLLCDGCVRVRLCLCVSVFFHVQLKPTLNKRKKVRNEPRCFLLVWLCACVDECVSDIFDFQTLSASSLNSVTLWNFSQTGAITFFVFVLKMFTLMKYAIQNRTKLFVLLLLIMDSRLCYFLFLPKRRVSTNFDSLLYLDFFFL